MGYAGVTLTFGSDSASLEFADSRSYEKIVDTSIDITQEQAINIAEAYVKNYSYTATLESGTKIVVSSLNVTGIGTISLGSSFRENSTLFPSYDVEVDVSNMNPSGL